MYTCSLLHEHCMVRGGASDNSLHSLIPSSFERLGSPVFYPRQAVVLSSFFSDFHTTRYFTPTRNLTRNRLPPLQKWPPSSIVIETSFRHGHRVRHSSQHRTAKYIRVSRGAWGHRQDIVHSGAGAQRDQSVDCRAAIEVEIFQAKEQRIKTRP